MNRKIIIIATIMLIIAIFFPKGIDITSPIPLWIRNAVALATVLLIIQKDVMIVKTSYCAGIPYNCKCFEIDRSQNLNLNIIEKKC